MTATRSGCSNRPWKALRNIGGEPVTIDFSPFQRAAELLYSGPWVAERLAAVGPFLNDHPGSVHPVVAQILAGGSGYSAVDTFRAMYELEKLRRVTEANWDDIDVLVLPTTGTTYTIEQIEADPIALNANLGRYTNFVNLLDLAAVALPAGFRRNGLPFGISFIGKAFSDYALLSLGARFSGNGAAPEESPGCVAIAVVGAHLSGQPLNRQLTSRGGRLAKTTTTLPGYRLYALSGTVPPKPGLVRDESFEGPGIEVEVWSVPENEFGGFVAEVPPPLGIGTAAMADGKSVKCFICEPWAVAGSLEISHYGGWRRYLASAVIPGTETRE